jgi:hypothetical protein
MTIIRQTRTTYTVLLRNPFGRQGELENYTESLRRKTVMMRQDLTRVLDLSLLGFRFLLVHTKDIDFMISDTYCNLM